MNPEELLKQHIKNLSKLKFDKHFFELANIIFNTKGAIITTGIGKTGLIAKRLSHNLGAIGLKSHFCDTLSLLHGQLGVLRDDYTVIAISDSGNTEELVQCIHHIKLTSDCKTLGILGNKHGSLIDVIDQCFVTGTYNYNKVSNEYPLSSHTTLSVSVDVLSGMVLSASSSSDTTLKNYHPGINSSTIIK